MSNIKYIIIAFLGIALMGENAFSQTKIVDHQAISWWANVNKYTLSNKLYLTSEIHVRRSDFAKHWQQFLFRPAINYVLNKNVHLTLGYTNIHTWPYGKQPIATITPENNIWQQMLLIQKHEKVTFKHRYRLEERWAGKTVFNDLGVASIKGTNYGQRFRYRFIFTVPIKKFGENKSLFFTGYDEIFVLLNNSFSINRFNQNWALLALGFHVNKKLTVQVGYRNQYIKKGDNIHYENNHALDFALKYHFDFRKKKE